MQTEVAEGIEEKRGGGAGLGGPHHPWRGKLDLVLTVGKIELIYRGIPPSDFWDEICVFLI